MGQSRWRGLLKASSGAVLAACWSGGGFLILTALLLVSDGGAVRLALDLFLGALTGIVMLPLSLLFGGVPATLAVLLIGIPFHLWAVRLGWGRGAYVVAGLLAGAVTGLGVSWFSSAIAPDDAFGVSIGWAWLVVCGLAGAVGGWRFHGLAGAPTTRSASAVPGSRSRCTGAGDPGPPASLGG